MGPPILAPPRGKGNITNRRRRTERHWRQVGIRQDDRALEEARRQGHLVQQGCANDRQSWWAWWWWGRGK